jgi:4-amino-4-deoxy-L-arabinose transferase-like glycosyltransferase
LGWVTFGSILLLAAGLRLWKIRSVFGNPFYDAAVRSMGQSWHAFFFGALEPSGTVSIDKPPVDLWLQVASTKILGYGLTGLHLPEALSGIAGCGLLAAVLWRTFGGRVALIAATAMAVLPISVLTARSDTMDSLLAALLLVALLCSWRGLVKRRTRWPVLAAVVLGVAFNVKLTECLVALPALALMWWWAAPVHGRLRTLLAAFTAFVVVGLSWVSVASLTPASQRPYPIGSATGSIWRVVFVFNGLDRFNGHGAVGLSSKVPGGGPGLTRLLSTGPSRYGLMIGVELLATLLLGALALASTSRERLREASSRPAGRLAIAIGVWFACGLVLFSGMRRLEPRYLEVLAPPMCALLAISLVKLARDSRRWVRLLLAAALVILAVYVLAVESNPGAWALVSLAGLGAGALLALAGAVSSEVERAAPGVLAVCAVIGICAVALSTNLELIRFNRSNSSFADASFPALSRYLRSHRGGARYEVASATVLDASGIIARDGLPVLVLNDVAGEIQTVTELRRAVLSGMVRFYFANHRCHEGPHCPANERWAYAHSLPVAHVSGLRRFVAG